jgi:hypothetical protein
MTVPSFTYILLISSFPSRDTTQRLMNENTIHKLDIIWRTISGCGALPGITLMVYLFFFSLQNTRLRQNESFFTKLYYFFCFGWRKSRSRDFGDREQSLITSNNSNSMMGLVDSTEPLVTIPQEVNTNNRSTTNRTSKNGIWNSIRSEEHLTRKLLGTAGTWFLFDVIFYGNTLFQQLILEVAFSENGATSADASMRRILKENFRSDTQPTIDSLLKTTRDSSILSLLALPGYLFTVFLLGKVTCRTIHQTPRFIQIQGFVWMTVLYGALGIWWNTLIHHQALLILLYGGTFFFSNYGPNSITFMLPSLTFSEDCRSTLNGICAACGKLGALVGASLFQPLSERLGPQTVMLLCAALSVFAGIVTVLCI